MPIVNTNVCQLGIEIDLAAMFKNLGAYAFNNLPDAIGANMGPFLITYGGFSPVGDKHIQNLSYAAVAAARGQFAIGKSAGAAFAILGIAVLIQDPVFPEFFYRINPPAYIQTLFNDNRTITVAGQQQCGKQSGRPGADYDGRTAEEGLALNWAPFSWFF